MPFQGDLKAIGLYDVFQNIVHNQLSGALKIEAERAADMLSAERWVGFRNGRVRFVSFGEGHGLPMRDFLVQRGFVDAKRFEALLEKKRRGRPALRTMLDEAGLLGEEQFRCAVALRVEEFLYELFALRDARFTFEDGDLPERIFDRESRGAALELDPMPLLMEAARRDDEWERIRRIVGTGRDFFVRVGEMPDADLDSQVWERLDGSRDVRTLETELPFGRFEIWSALASLLQSNHLRAATPDEILHCVDSALEAGEEERARRLLERACEYERNDRGLRTRLSELCEAARDHKRAAEHRALAALAALADDDVEDARQHYARALELSPEDLSLRESYVELLATSGTAKSYEREALDLAQRFASGGLGDRARQIYEKALEHPELAMRIALLEGYACILRDQGNVERAKAWLRAAVAHARGQGDEELERDYVELALRVLPEDVEFAVLRDELENGVRGVRKERRRAWGRLGAATLVAAIAFVACIEEMSFRRGIDKILNTLPQRIARGEAVEVLAELQHVRDAHPFALSRGTGTVLASSLVEAERIEIDNSIARDRYADARKRIRVLEPLAGPKRSIELASLRQRVERRAQVQANLEAWVSGEGSSRAFIFGVDDALQVVGIYPRLAAAGRAGVRARFLELATPIGLPIFVHEFLRGTREQESTRGALAIRDLLREYLSMPHDVDWQRARDDAYARVVDAWLVGNAKQKESARELLPLFVVVPPELPRTREDFFLLSSPAR